MMTKQQAVAAFMADVLPDVKAQYEQDGVPDWPARSEAWNNYTDALRKDRQITAKQYDTWTHPPCCERRRK